jgi:hypothetical protein
LSKYHEKCPFEFEGRKVNFEPAESTEKIKGGNSNWRGPIWFPTSYLLIESLKKLSESLGDDIKIKVGTEQEVNLKQMAASFSERLVSIFKNESHIRPFYGEKSLNAKNTNWIDCLYFHEYFHSETGKGLGASHQCGWTVLVANLIDNLRK